MNGRVRALAAAPRAAPAPVLARCMSAAPGLQVTVDTLNADLKKAQYAVRGELVIKAMKIQKKLEAGDSEGIPFDNMVYCNIGNPQSLKQKPISFNRQVMSLLECPDLLEHPKVGEVFAPDAIERAALLHKNIPSGLGAYSESQGIGCIRENVAKFITARDGHASSADNIFITDGASPAVQMTIRSMIRDEKDAFMIPVPQYPLYSASIALYGGSPVGYELDEDDNWGLKAAELEKRLAAAREEGLNVRALCVINPGNPTGNCMTEENMREVVEFCQRENIILMADEVYQENTWLPDLPFHSFKKVASDMGVLADPDTDGDAASGLQLASYHSVSKGFLGECGKRGGYVEFCGFPAAVREELYKLVSISLCSNIAGQVMVDLMVAPPVEGDASYEGFMAERGAILSSLQRRAEKLVAALNELEGVDCLPAQGALYVFPSITLGPGAQAAAEAAGKAPDTFYCLELLKATGIVVVPGTGFTQRPGTWHFRATILPPEDQIDSVIDRLGAFHADFVAKYPIN